MEGFAQLVLNVILLLAVVGLVVLAVYLKTNTTESPEVKSKWKAAISIAAIPLVLLVLSFCVVIVPAGSVGVVTAFGKVSDDTLPPGIHLRLPFVNAVHNIDTRVQPHPFEEIDAASAEYQTVKLSGIMNYHIDGQYASDLYQRVGDDFAGKIIDPAFNDFIKSVVPNYGIATILGKRDEIRSLAKTDLQANLAQYHIVVDDIYIANVSFSPEYEAAIEAKQVAQQQVETEKQVTQQKIQQANQAVEAAKGEANAKIEQAKGQATADIERAKGEAQASIEGNKGRIALAETQAKNNALIANSLTPELLQLRLIENIADNIQVVYLPSNGNFFLDPTKLLVK